VPKRFAVDQRRAQSKASFSSCLRGYAGPGGFLKSEHSVDMARSGWHVGFRQGALVTLEANPDYAAVAKRNIEVTVLSATVSVMVAPAVATLAQLIIEKVEPFDMELSMPTRKPILTIRVWRLSCVVLAPSSLAKMSSERAGWSTSPARILM
jgi:hypothetical protein